MFHPHHYTNNENRYGIISNEDKSRWCVWSISNDNKVLTWNDPFEQAFHLTEQELNVALVWITGQLLRSLV